MLYLNSDGSLTDCNDVEDVCIQENELVQDYKKLTRKKQVRKMVELTWKQQAMKMVKLHGKISAENGQTLTHTLMHLFEPRPVVFLWNRKRVLKMMKLMHKEQVCKMVIGQPYI